MRQFYENEFPPKMMRRMKKVYFNVTDKQKEICKANIPYRAEIKFRLATDTMTVTVTSRRLSFFDKLSSIGKKILRNR